MTKEQKRKLISDYMAKCPFIEFHEIVELNKETATIDIAFDQEWEGGPTGVKQRVDSSPRLCYKLVRKDKR